MKRNREKGSMTLEAALVLPIFIFLLLFMYGIIMFFSGREMMSHAALQAGQSLSLDSFAGEKLIGENSEVAQAFVSKLYSSITTNSKDTEYFSSDKKWYEGKVASQVEKRFWGYFIGGSPSKAEKLLPLIGVKGGSSSVKFSDSYKDDNNDLHIIIKYEQQFFFDFGGQLTLPREIEVVTHMWGLDEVEDKSSSSGGGSGSSGEGGGGIR